MPSLLIRRGLSKPPRSPFALPSWNAGYDQSHIAGPAQVSAVFGNSNFIDLLRGGKGVSAGSITISFPSPVGPGAGASTQGLAAGYTLSNIPTPPVGTQLTCAAILMTPSTFATAAQALVGQGTNNVDAGGFYVRIEQTTGALRVICPAGTTPPAASFNLAASTPYFVAASACPVAAGNVTNYIAVNLLTGQVQSAATTGATSAIGVGGTANLIAEAGRGFSGTLVAAMTNLKFMPMPLLLQWAYDPWAFWYPK